MESGSTLFVDGGAGGVGAAAVQIAVARGATVIASASDTNHDYLREIGAIPVHYGLGMIDRVRALPEAAGIDAVLDVAGKTAIEDLISLAPEPAQVVSIANFKAAEAGARVTGGGADSQADEGLGRGGGTARAEQAGVQVRDLPAGAGAPRRTRSSSRVTFAASSSCCPRVGMPSTLPEGERPPADGRLPDAAAAEIGTRPVGLYVHIPFCRVRCGYCDFNTYTADQLGTDPGSSQAGYVAAAVAELDLAARVLGRHAPPVSTVFFGGGTPTLLPPGDLGRLLAAVEDRFGLLPGAEVTTESNPESVTAADLAELRALGFNRISFGMQSAVPHVLAALDRIHAPDRPVQAVAEARAAGFADISLDLIYGGPGESLADWETSLDAAIAAEPEHLSAYALIVEDGTKLAARIRRGELPPPDDDDLADKYLLADERLTAAGLNAYEVSNWAARPPTPLPAQPRLLAR